MKKKTLKSLSLFIILMGAQCYKADAQGNWTVNPPGGTGVTDMVTDNNTNNVGVGVNPTIPVPDRLTVNGNIGFEETQSGYNFLNGRSVNNGLTLYGNYSFAGGGGLVMNSYNNGGNLKLVANSGLPGVTDNAFDFMTYNGGAYNSRMNISKDGKVGINTSAPDDHLSVNGNIGFSENQSGYSFLNSRSVNNGLVLYSNYSYGGGSGITMNSYNNGGDMRFVANSGNPGISSKAFDFITYDGTSFTSKMIINKDGKVGINTGAPDDHLSVNGNIGFSENQSGYSFLNSRSVNNGLVLYSNYSYGGGSGITMNSYNNGGAIRFVANSGNPGISPEAFDFITYDGSNFTSKMHIDKDGDVTIPDLVGSGNRMVIADGSGVLGTQSIPVNTDNQQLSVSGTTLAISGGNSVTLPAASGDNLGNHTATTGLNMTLHDITGANNIIATKLDANTVKGIFGNFDHVHCTGDAAFDDDVNIKGDATCTANAWSGSDIRYKKNIEEINNVKSQLFKVVPHSYDFRVGEIEGKKFNDKHQFGFIAQEVEKVYPNLTKIGQDGYYAVNYEGFIPLLLQALKEEDAQVQQQLKTIDELKAQAANASIDKQALEIQKAKITELENKLAALEANMEVCCQNKGNNTHTSDNGSTGAIVKSTLEQNVPNPFGAETKIGFHIVGKYQAAFIGIYNLNGEQISKIPVQQGPNFVMVSAGQLKPGMYVYSLVVDNDLIDSKKMVVSE